MHSNVIPITRWFLPSRNRASTVISSRIPRLSKEQETLPLTRTQTYRKLIVCGSVQLSGSGARSPVLPS